MIDRRRWPTPTGPSIHSPPASGPRRAMVSVLRCRVSRCVSRFWLLDSHPAIPPIVVLLVIELTEAFQVAVLGQQPARLAMDVARRCWGLGMGFQFAEQALQSH